jgi:hypothetical protein
MQSQTFKYKNMHAVRRALALALTVCVVGGCERASPAPPSLRDHLTARDPAPLTPAFIARARALDGRGAPSAPVATTSRSPLEAVAALDLERVRSGEDIRIAGLYTRAPDGEVTARGCGSLLSAAVSHDTSELSSSSTTDNIAWRLRLDALTLPDEPARARLHAHLSAWISQCDTPPPSPGAEVWIQETPSAPFLVAWWPQEPRLLIHPALTDILAAADHANAASAPLSPDDLRQSQAALLFNTRDLNRCATEALSYCHDCLWTAARPRCGAPFPSAAPTWTCAHLYRQHLDDRFSTLAKATAFCTQELRAGLRAPINPAAPTDADACAQAVVSDCLACVVASASDACLTPFPTTEPTLTCPALLDTVQPYEAFSQARGQCLQETVEARPDLDYCLMFGLQDGFSYGGYGDQTACPTVRAPFLPEAVGQGDAFHPNGDLVRRNAEYFCDTRTDACVTATDDYPLNILRTNTDDCVSSLRYYCATCGQSNPSQCPSLFEQSTPQQDCQDLLSIQPDDAGLFTYCLALLEGPESGLTPACLNASQLCVNERAIPKDLVLRSIEALSARFGAFTHGATAPNCRAQARACALGQPVDPLPPALAIPSPPPDPACGE